MARTQINALLDELWATYRELVEAASGLSNEQLDTQVPAYGGRQTALRNSIYQAILVMSAIVFSKRDVALAAVRGVERAHQRIRGSLESAAGPFAAGTPYSGRDPELVQWVWATLVDTSLVVYERFVEDLSDEIRERYYADHRSVGSLLGVPEELLPADHVAFRAWYGETLESEALTVTDTARAIAASVLDPVVPLPGIGLVRNLTAGLLPSRLRQAYGLAWDDSRAAQVEALSASVRALRKGTGKAAEA